MSEERLGSVACLPAASLASPSIDAGSATPLGDGDVDYITAALSWYDGGPAGEDVQAAWRRLRLRLLPWTGVLLRTEWIKGGSGAHVIVEAQREDGSGVEVIRSYADVQDSSIYHWARLPTEDGSQTRTASDGEGKSEGLMPTEPNTSGGN